MVDFFDKKMPESELKNVPQLKEFSEHCSMVLGRYGEEACQANLKLVKIQLMVKVFASLYGSSDMSGPQTHEAVTRVSEQMLEEFASAFGKYKTECIGMIFLLKHALVSLLALGCLPKNVSLCEDLALIDVSSFGSSVAALQVEFALKVEAFMTSWREKRKKLFENVLQDCVHEAELQLESFRAWCCLTLEHPTPDYSDKLATMLDRSEESISDVEEMLTSIANMGEKSSDSSAMPSSISFLLKSLNECREMVLCHSLADTQSDAYEKFSQSYSKLTNYQYEMSDISHRFAFIARALPPIDEGCTVKTVKDKIKEINMLDKAELKAFSERLEKRFPSFEKDKSDLLKAMESRQTLLKMTLIVFKSYYREVSDQMKQKLKRRVYDENVRLDKDSLPVLSFNFIQLLQNREKELFEASSSLLRPLATSSDLRPSLVDLCLLREILGTEGAFCRAATAGGSLREEVATVPFFRQESVDLTGEGKSRPIPSTEGENCAGSFFFF